MTTTGPTAAIVDTMVISWLLHERPHKVADSYRTLIDAACVLLAFQTVMQLRYGALRAGWGELRGRRLERRIAELTVVQPDDAMIRVCAELRQASRQIGHPLGAKIHDGDRWIAAAAIRLDLPLVSHDRVFQATPGLASHNYARRVALGARPCAEPAATCPISDPPQPECHELAGRALISPG